jgi:flagellar hook assembly protein FlgD
MPENWSASTNIIGTPGCNNNNNICLNFTQEVIPLPDRIKIFQNYPNPFNPITNIHYLLPQDSFVSLNIYNLMGKKVKTIVNNFQSAGEKYVRWNSTNDDNKNVSSGIYFYTLTTGNFIKTKKMILVK